MKISHRGLELIKKYEGCRLDAYLCPAGVLTIGYGHTTGVVKGQHISQEQADAFLRKDVEKFELHVNGYTKYNWSQNEFDALVSFAFNIGSIKQLTSNGLRTKAEIAEKMLLYNKASGTVLSGLTKRRKEERDLFLESDGNLKDLDTVAQEVIDGVWGNGSVRKKALTEAGYSYTKVQAKVNQILLKRSK